MFQVTQITENRHAISTPVGEFICYRAAMGPRPWHVIGSGLFFESPLAAAQSMSGWAISLLEHYYRRSLPRVA